MAASSSMTVPQTLSRIFAEELPSEKLALRRLPQPAPKDPSTGRDASNPSKRQKREPPTNSNPTRLLESKELILHVAAFLNPFEVQALACCCKATCGVLTMTKQLDGLFQEFRIMKSDADRFHNIMNQQSTTENDTENRVFCWQDVLNSLLEALKELYNIYGPYQIHPLHAALAGEIILLQLPRPLNPHFRGNRGGVANNADFPLTLESVWNGGAAITGVGRIADLVVLGNNGDYFVFQEEYMDEADANWYRLMGGNAQQFLPGPGRVLLQEKRLPFINMFTREDEEHTDQMGIYFPNDKINDGEEIEGGGGGDNAEGAKTDDKDGDNVHSDKKPNNNDENSIPVQVFCMNYQDLPEPDIEVEDFDQWYHKDLIRYSDCTSLVQAWCQYIPLLPRDNPLDEWTQLLRAAWLQAHQIAPFNGTEHGKQLWDQVLQSIGEEDLKALRLNNKEEATASEASDAPNNEYILVLDTYRDYEREEARNTSKERSMVYLRQNHKFAKASDYV